MFQLQVKPPDAIFVQNVPASDLKFVFFSIFVLLNLDIFLSKTDYIQISWLLNTNWPGSALFAIQYEVTIDP